MCFFILNSEFAGYFLLSVGYGKNKPLLRNSVNQIGQWEHPWGNVLTGNSSMRAQPIVCNTNPRLCKKQGKHEPVIKPGSGILFNFLDYDFSGQRFHCMD